MQQPLISAKQTAQQLGVSLSFIYRQIKHGTLASYRVGADILGQAMGLGMSIDLLR